MKKRFFTKKSVALIFTAIILVGFSSFNFTNAAVVSKTPLNSDSFNCPPPLDDIISDSVIIAESPAKAKSDKVHNLIIRGLDIGCEAQVAGKNLTPDELAQIQDFNNQAKALAGSDSTFTDAILPLTNAISAINALRNGGLSAATTTVMTLVTGLGNYALGIALAEIIGPWIAVLVCINMIASAGVTIAGLLFDLSIHFAIFDIGDLFSAGGVVNTLWTMIRDMLNISFIFILLYISITMIIGSWGAKSKTTIVNVILSAIFINFSMFITKILIDAGNMVAVQFYNVISPAGMGLSISQMLFKGTTLFDTVKAAVSLSGQTNMLISLILQLICLAITNWVFLYFAIIMIGRTAMLVFLTMTSPIGFVGKTIPFLGKISEKWWETLISQIMVAPFIMFFLYFITQLIKVGSIITSLPDSLSGSSGNLNTILAAPSLNVSGLFVYLLIIILLWQGLKIAKNMSGKVGEMSVKIIGTAVAAVATVGVGAAVLGAGAVGAGAAEAATAAGSKGGISAIRARLAFSANKLATNAKGALKNTGKAFADSPVTKFMTGGYKEGALGVASSIARERVVRGISHATGGVVDINKIKTAVEKSEKETEKALAEKADSFVKPHTDKEKELKDTQENIEKQVKEKLAAEEDPLKKDADEKKKIYDKKEEIMTKPGYNPTTTEKSEFDKAKVDLTAADDKVKKFNDTFNKRLEQEKEKVAQTMGVIGTKLADGTISYLQTIEDQLTDTREKIMKGREERLKYIKENVAEGSFLGTFIFGKDAREKMANKFRAQKGNYDADKGKVGKNIKKILDDAGIKLDEEEGGEEAKKPPEEPKKII